MPLVKWLNIFRNLVVIHLFGLIAPLSPVFEHALNDIGSFILIDLFPEHLLSCRVLLGEFILFSLPLQPLLLHFLDWIIPLLFERLLLTLHSEELHFLGPEPLNVLPSQNTSHSLLDEYWPLQFLVVLVGLLRFSFPNEP